MTDPRLEALWQATPTAYRYTIGGVRHVEVKRGDRRFIVPLSEAEWLTTAASETTVTA